MFQVDATIENARKVLRLATKHGLTVDPAINEIFARIKRCNDIPGFNFILKDFQADGVAWLESQLGTGLLADEQGTGKTIQVLAYAHKNQTFPMLVVCPNSLKYNWRNEINATTGTKYLVNIVGKAYGKKQLAKKKLAHPNVTYSRTPVQKHDIYIINYDALQSNVDGIESLGIKFMAIDESHKIKNPKAARTKAITRLALGEIDDRSQNNRTSKKVGSGVEKVTLISGTPMLNRPKELWTTLRIIGKWVPEFEKWTKFAFRYCNPQKSYHGWDFNGCSNGEELNRLLTTHVMLRRLKLNVLSDLPAKTFRTVPIDFDRKEYDKVEAAFDGIDWNSGMETIMRLGGKVPASDETIVAIQKLREIAAYAKIDGVVDWIKDYTENGEKLVVFAHNRLLIDKIKHALEQDTQCARAVDVVYGGVSDDDRESAIARFQFDTQSRVIIVGITSGGFGITLTSAGSVAFVQLPWTPGEVGQCIDRVHRIGQKAKNVSIFNLVAEGTIEESMSAMLLSKGEIIDSVLDNGAKVNTFAL